MEITGVLVILIILIIIGVGKARSIRREAKEAQAKERIEFEARMSDLTEETTDTVICNCQVELYFDRFIRHICWITEEQQAPINNKQLAQIEKSYREVYQELKGTVIEVKPNHFKMLKFLLRKEGLMTEPK